MNVAEVNDKEIFFFPNFLNMNNCKFIKYGYFSINSVLENSKPSYYAQSVIHQLSKTDRNFVYHIKLLPKFERKISKMTNNGRIYQIHVNMSQNSLPIDQLKSYFLAMLIDIELQKKEIMNSSAIEMSIRSAEIAFSKVDFVDLQSKLENQGWSLEYIYLDPKKNRYNIHY